MKTEMNKIGERVKHHRLKRKLTQKELAEKIGVTHEWVCKIERGKANITLSLLLSIADNLNIELKQITAEDSKLLS